MSNNFIPTINSINEHSLSNTRDQSSICTNQDDEYKVTKYKSGDKVTLYYSEVKDYKFGVIDNIETDRLIIRLVDKSIGVIGKIPSPQNLRLVRLSEAQGVRSVHVILVKPRWNSILENVEAHINKDGSWCYNENYVVSKYQPDKSYMFNIEY